eukprot:CAMPEP_0177701732 /NCGR_PEP_ID=MMETSP0484_2-20121128/6764_1 /TAXON_ID=354590 /ORGANISM="Rhodomonas lens, Strain RHODO" /LENGTH=136 /DNA_ID=CAMNT_0019212977 /DNA_START=110 /DNA_END=517 /DNA_ORIENTATION=+
MAAVAGRSLFGSVGARALTFCASRNSRGSAARAFHATASTFDEARCPYAVLDLDPGASQKEVKKAYMVLARKLHPDVSTYIDAKEKFAEVNSAYQMLSNQETRRLYDAGQIDTEGKEVEYSELDTFHDMLWRQVMW